MDPLTGNAAKKPEVNQILDELQMALEELEKVTDNLGSRLVPVMQTDAPSNPDKVKEMRSPSCAVSEILLEKIAKVQNVTDRLSSLERRLEI